MATSMWPVQGASTPQTGGQGGFQDVAGLLASLNLSSFEGQFKALGVESVADLKYVTEGDLREMKMTVIQCRKFAELSGGVFAACVGSTLAIADVPAKAEHARPRSRSREPGGHSPQKNGQEIASVGAGSDTKSPSWKEKGAGGDHKSPSWKDKGDKSSWKDKKSSWKDGHNGGHKASWKDGQNSGNKTSWNEEDSSGWKNAPWDGVWKEPGWKPEQPSGDSKWKDGSESSGKSSWKDEKAKWGSWKDDKHWKKSKPSWKDSATEPETPSKESPTNQSQNSAAELLHKASAESPPRPKEQAAWSNTNAIAQSKGGGGGGGGGLLVAKAGSAKAAVHVVHAPGRGSVVAPPPQSMFALPGPPPAAPQAPSPPALGGLGNDEIFKTAETLLKHNGQRKFYWEEVTKLKSSFNFSERIELGLKLLEPTKLNALLRENGDIHKLLEQAGDKDEVLRGLIKRHDPYVDQIVTQLEVKDLEMNGPR
jgi:hypothetical protein